MKFPEFNKVVNSNDSQCYIPTCDGIRHQPMTFKDMNILTRGKPDTEVEWILPKGYYIIVIEGMDLINIIAQQNELCMVYTNSQNNTTNIICCGDAKTTKNNLLACGLQADIIAYNNTRTTTVLLPFKKPNNTSQKLNVLNCVYGGATIAEPLWLKPLRRENTTVMDGFTLPIQGNTIKILSAHLNKLSKFNIYDKRDIIEFINNTFCTTPCSADELDQLLEDSNNSTYMQFFDKQVFQHYKLGDYVIGECNIKYDKTTQKLFYFDPKKKVYVSSDNYLRSYITKLCPQLRHHQKEETISYIYDTLYENEVEFNTNPYTIVFKNGILDISDMSFQQMSSDRLESIQINCNYNANAYSATADEFFQTATSGNKETELLLYQAIGYAMLKTSELAKSFLCVGSGRNGKSTFFDVINKILGEENTASITFKDLSNTFRPSALVNKLASLAADISSQGMSDTDTFKNIAAGDKIFVERKHQDGNTVRLFATMFYACNKMPSTPDTTQGFYRRFIIIPFNANLSNVATVQGMKFKQQLLTQESIEYIAYKAVKAIYDVFNTTMEFIEPQEVKDMKRLYQVQNSSVLSWYNEAIKDFKVLDKMGLSKAYLSYTQWCEDSNKRKMNKVRFANQLESELNYKFN